MTSSGPEKKRNDDLHGEVKKLHKRLASSASGSGLRWVGNVPFLTDEAAKSLTASTILEIGRTGGKKALAGLIKSPSALDMVLGLSADILGIEQRAALDATSTPLPTIYIPQVVELVWKWGQARQFATVYPLGAANVKLPRLKAGEDDFAFLGTGTSGGLSQSVGEKKVSAELISFDPSKFGGMIRIPTEIEEDTFIPLGQFLARYIARQTAKGEDKTLFIGDGTATYGGNTGVVKYCVTNGYNVNLATTKTHPSDAGIADFRALRPMVNAAVYTGDACYYMHPTMDALLVTYNTINNPLIYQRAVGNQPATLDGFPIRWSVAFQPYTTAVALSAPLAAFGDLSYWYLGERGTIRVEMSRDVYFATDELAMRALERFTVQAMGIDAMSSLQTAAS